MACVVVNDGGPATLIESDRGIKVSLGNLEHLVNAYTQELESLVIDPEQVQALGTAAHHHALQYYTWDKKAQKTLEIYDYIKGKQKTKPNFWQQPVFVSV